MQFGAKPLFSDVTVKFGGGNRYGLIGANGCGKSTFMKILGGELEPSAGSVAIDANERVGRLRQDQFAFETERVLDVVLMGHAEMWAAMSERDAIYADPQAGEEELLRAADLEAKYAEYGGYTAEARAGELLHGLGVATAQHQGLPGQLRRLYGSVDAGEAAAAERQREGQGPYFRSRRVRAALPRTQGQGAPGDFAHEADREAQGRGREALQPAVPVHPLSRRPEGEAAPARGGGEGPCEGLRARSESFREAGPLDRGGREGGDHRPQRNRQDHALALSDGEPRGGFRHGQVGGKGEPGLLAAGSGGRIRSRREQGR